MSMFGLQELAAENFRQCLPVFIWVLSIHSAQHVDFGLPVSSLLAKMSKVVAHELILIISKVVWKHFPSYIFPPWPIFLMMIHFSLQVPSLGWVFAPALPLATWQKSSATCHDHTKLLGDHQPPIPLTGSGMLWELQSHKEKSNIYWNTVEWVHVSMKCAKFFPRRGFMTYLFMS